MDQSKVEKAQNVLRTAAEMSATYYKQPLIITYSGGKDSDVVLRLALDCLQPNAFEVMYSVTTVDAPETIRHINAVFRELESRGVHTVRKVPMYKGEKTNMYKLIVEHKMPPSRFARYCCSTLKEASTPNRFIAVGVREEESTGRKGRDSFETWGGKKKDALYFSAEHVAEVFRNSLEEAKKQGKAPEEADVLDCTFIKLAKQNKSLTCSPIYEWTNTDVWTYIRENNIPYNPLYDRGYRRVGCIGCPMAGYKERVKEFNDYPEIKARYIAAFDKMLQARKEAGMVDYGFGVMPWETVQDVFDWWIGENNINCYGQLKIEDMENENGDGDV